ncbi:hypothetical protein [Novosphingobium sp. JCM 18896]|uniref:hypothetical protein n=1 Tax=Novosphingobium sp. JCM 18896 TaxID=2989731 RepID=UPI0022217B26|nr:hypothetical protein [Novosphingobium sp. JCM 18896]MCW1430110.1 hypothetical protein [Novosphingobium sp. JCM 18896]
MFRKTLIAPLMAATALALTVSPAYAGKADRARQAIAAAEAKITTAEQMGSATELPARHAEARAELARAKESLNAGNKSTSIDEAIHASALADATIGELQRRKDMAVADANAARDADVSVAQQQAAAAQEQAAHASARADMAQQQAANSAADANAARSALIAQQNQQVETTVTTQAPAPRRAARTVTRKTTTTTARRAPAPAPATTTTTTTIKQAVN